MHMVQAARTAAPSWFEFRKRGGRSDENSCFSGPRERKRQPLRLVLVLRQMAHPRPWGGPPRGALRRPEKPIRRNWICTKDRRPAAGRLGAGFKQAAEAIGLLFQANHGREKGEKRWKHPGSARLASIKRRGGRSRRPPGPPARCAEIVAVSRSGRSRRPGRAFFAFSPG